eukprot:5705924-Prymnesium_polylepis.4
MSSHRRPEGGSGRSCTAPIRCSPFLSSRMTSRSSSSRRSGAGSDVVIEGIAGGSTNASPEPVAASAHCGASPSSLVP